MAAIAAGGLAGCGAAGTRIANTDAALPANEDSAAFLDRISSQVNVSENDALRGILMLLDGQDQAGTFGQRVEKLAGREVVPASWDFDAARPITRGRLAYMIYQAAKIPGGVTLRLIGPTERYCLRELQYRRMMTRGAPYTPVSGMEFVAVLTRAEMYVRTGKFPSMVGEEVAESQ